jgi:hypothetical protein
MYPDSAKTAVPSQKMVGEVLDRVSKQNAERESLITEIQIRIHNILDRRYEETCEEATPNKPSENDFFQALGLRIVKADEHNRRLEKILNHLNQII